MSGQVALVVGASKGIGLSLAKRLVGNGYIVYGTSRKHTEALAGTDSLVEITGVDVSTAACKDVLKEKLQDVPKIDVLVVMAGAVNAWKEKEKIAQVEIEDIESLMRVNAFGSLHVVQAVQEKLVKGSKVVLVTSRMGSIGDNTSGGEFAYRVSKAAMNQIGKTMSHELGEQGIITVLGHPGMVQTELIPKEYFHLSTPIEKCVDGFVETLNKLTPEHNGAFLHLVTGESLPW